MSIEDVLDIIRSFFEAIVDVFNALMGLTKKEEDTEAQA